MRAAFFPTLWVLPDKWKCKITVLKLLMDTKKYVWLTKFSYEWQLGSLWTEVSHFVRDFCKTDVAAMEALFVIRVQLHLNELWMEMSNIRWLPRPASRSPRVIHSVKPHNRSCCWKCAQQQSASNNVIHVMWFCPFPLATVPSTSKWQVATVPSSSTNTSRFFRSCRARSPTPSPIPSARPTNAPSTRPGNSWTKWWNCANTRRWTWRIRPLLYWIYCPTPIRDWGWFTANTRTIWQCCTAMNTLISSLLIWWGSANRRLSCSRRARRRCSMRIRIIGGTWRNLV